MKRKARLASARSWITKYPGKNLVRGYRKHFGVDIVCAIKELEILGIKINKAYKDQLLITVANSSKACVKKKKDPEEWFDPDTNDQFAYIAGYTEAGFAFGTTWEEWERSTWERYL